MSSRTTSVDQGSFLHRGTGAMAIVDSQRMIYDSRFQGYGRPQYQLYARDQNKGICTEVTRLGLELRATLAYHVLERAITTNL